MKRYLAQARWAPAAVSPHPKALDAHAAWLAERFHRHAGNADVVRQDLLKEYGVRVSLRKLPRQADRLKRDGAGV